MGRGGRGALLSVCAILAELPSAGSSVSMLSSLAEIHAQGHWPWNGRVVRMQTCLNDPHRDVADRVASPHSSSP
eukprot:2745788-Rhodomonas_salina.3